jgi:hypothetical protein
MLAGQLNKDISLTLILKGRNILKNANPKLGNVNRNCSISPTPDGSVLLHPQHFSFSKQRFFLFKLI